jgi:hypothetical protein
MGLDTNNQDDFSSKIADAVDDLFNPVRQIEIDPATNEVREIGGNTLPKKEEVSVAKGSDAPSAAAASSAAPSVNIDKQETLAKLDQALMTLDWEVSRSNVGNMRDLLDQTVKEYDLGALASAGGVIALMHTLLGRMSDSPENVPTSGPLALKNSLTAIKTAAMEGQPYGAETRTQLEQAQTALVSVLPEGTSAASVVAPSAVAASVTLPEPLNVALRHHLGRLDSLLKQRLLPAEDFFGKEKSMTKLYVILKGVNEQLSQQRSSMKQILTGSIPSVIPVNSPVPVAIDIGAECQGALQYHIQVLDHCSRRIAPIENLFSNMDGQDKLHAIHYEVRCGLKDQKDYLVAVLAGETVTPPVPAKMELPDAPPVADCPWSMLVSSKWQGRAIAFIPEQVCFDGKPGLFCRNLGKMISFELKKLKSWPWSGLKARFRGDLAEKTNKELVSFEFPVINIPIEGNGKCGKNVVVLFAESKGGVVFTETGLENVSVDDGFSWIPERRKEGVVAGFLSDDSGEMIPVVDLARL